MRRKLGQVLVDMGLLSPPDIQAGLMLQTQTQQRLGELLVNHKKITREQLLEALSIQLNVAVVADDRLRALKPARIPLSTLTREEAHRHGILPVFYDEANRAITVVVSDPLLGQPLENLKSRYNLAKIRLLMASDEVLREALDSHYAWLDEVGPLSLASTPSPKISPAPQRPATPPPSAPPQMDIVTPVRVEPPPSPRQAPPVERADALPRPAPTPAAPETARATLRATTSAEGQMPGRPVSLRASTAAEGGHVASPSTGLRASTSADGGNSSGNLNLSALRASTSVDNSGSGTGHAVAQILRSSTSVDGPSQAGANLRSSTAADSAPPSAEPGKTPPSPTWHALDFMLGVVPPSTSEPGLAMARLSMVGLQELKLPASVLVDLTAAAYVLTIHRLLARDVNLAGAAQRWTESGNPGDAARILADFEGQNPSLLETWLLRWVDKLLKQIPAEEVSSGAAPILGGWQKSCSDGLARQALDALLSAAESWQQRELDDILKRFDTLSAPSV